MLAPPKSGKDLRMAQWYKF